MSHKKCKISEIVKFSKDSERPILSYFQNGEISAEGAKSMKCCLAQDENNRKSKTLIATSGTALYHGKIGVGFPNDLVDTFIAVRNKATNKIRLVQVEECSLISTYQDAKNDNSALLHFGKDDAQRILQKNFGTKKSSSHFEKVLKSKVNVDVIKEQLNTTVENVMQNQSTADDSFSSKLNETIAKYDSLLPPLNENATTVKGAYPIENLIEQNVLDVVVSEVASVLDNCEESGIMCGLFQNMLLEIRDSPCPDSEENLLNIAVIFYADALYKVTRVPKNQKTFPNLEPVRAIHTDIITKFTVPSASRNFITLYTRNKSACYLVLFALLLSPNYSLSTEDFKMYFQFPANDLSRYCQSIGATKNYLSDAWQLKTPIKRVLVEKKFVGKKGRGGGGGGRSIPLKK